MSSIFITKIKKIIKIKKVLDFLKITFHKYAIIKTKNMIELDSNPVYRKDGYRVWYNGEKYWLFTWKDILAITNETVVFSDYKEYPIYVSSTSDNDKEPYKEFLANFNKLQDEIVKIS